VTAVVQHAELGWEAVTSVDRSGQAVQAVGLGEQLRDALCRVEAAALRPVRAPGGVVVAGMGGSAIGARLAVGVLGDRARRPVVVADGYELPPWVGQDVLVLCSSYSGATEETLACYEDAGRRGALRVVAGAGGPLAERARRDNVPVISFPPGLQPRAAVGYSLVSALGAVAAAGAAPAMPRRLERAANHLDACAAEWGPAGHEAGLAKALARRLHGTVLVITGAGATAPVAYRWKCQCNENAKMPAFCGALPEVDHNEVCGWASAAELGPFSAVFLEDRDDPPAITRRTALTAQLAAAGARTVERVAVRGPGRLERILALVLLGDLVSLYLAVLRGVDPVDVDAITRLKAALSGRLGP
jgi:glucose/mannose-6-phosphate isomerase